MATAPEPILDAALLTMHFASVHVRNITLHPDPNTTKQVNDLMESLHEIPDFLRNWDKHNLDELRLQLKCFDHTQCQNSPNLIEIFERRLAIHSGAFPKDNLESWTDIRKFIEEYPDNEYWSALQSRPGLRMTHIP